MAAANPNKPVTAISGLGGFIGRNLSDYLRSKGHDVSSIPRQLLSSPDYLEQHLHAIKPTNIIHLAAYGNHYQQKDVDEIMAANIIKTYTLLRAAYKIDYNLFINVSTSSVYGKKTRPMREQDSLDTDTFYGATKVAGEYLARAFSIQGEKNIVNVRPFSIYGRGESTKRLIPKIISAIRLNDPMTLYPNPMHDWTHIYDFCTGIETLIENPEYYKGEAVNVGTGYQYTNMQVYETLLRISGLAFCDAVEIVEDGKRNYDLQNWRADPSKLKALGWKPKYSLESGLIETYEYYKRLYDENGQSTTLKEAMDETLSQAMPKMFKSTI